MLNILKRIFIGVAIALIVFLIKDTCFAATTIQNYSYKIWYHDYISANLGCNSSLHSTNFTNFGTGTSGGVGSLTGSICPYKIDVRFTTAADSSQQFLPGNLYTIKFTYNSNPRTNGSIAALDRPMLHLQYFDGTNYTDCSTNTCNLVSYSYNYTANSNYGMDVSVSFTVATAQRYIMLSYSPIENWWFDSNHGVNFIGGTSTNSADATIVAIADAAGVVSNSVTNGVGEVLVALQNFMNLFTGPFNPTSPNLPSWALPSDYAVVEAQVEGLAGSGHGIGEALDVDYTDFSGVFSWLWFMVNRIVSWNSKFFFVLTSCLTLSFVGLVFGR